MKRLMLVLVIGLALTGCSNLGLGQAACDFETGNFSSSNIMTVQAVPTAKYTPCVNELPLGWDNVDWFAERGRSGIEIQRFTPPSTFLKATVTESCNVAEAEVAESGYPDINRFEDIEQQDVTIEISIVPSGELPLSTAHRIVDDLTGVEINGRPVVYTIDDAIDRPVSARSDVALENHDFVWIVDEVDAQDGTVQQRSNIAQAAGHGLQPGSAMQLIEDAVPGVFYRGNWYFTFEGGCITYEFNTTGTLAETIAARAEDTIGFFPALELREFARDAGFDIG